SGSNNLHGTLLWRYQSQRFNSVSNLDKLVGAEKPVFSDNNFGFTLGGPIRKNKTFFFGGYQQHNRHSTDHTTLQLPTADAVTRLRALFPGNPRLDYYLGPLGTVRGTALPFALDLGVDPKTQQDRGSVLFASTPFNRAETNDGPQGMIRADHYRSE